MTETRWLSRREAAEHLRMKPGTFDKMVREGRITRYSASPRHPLYDREELDALIEGSVNARS